MGSSRGVLDDLTFRQGYQSLAILGVPAEAIAAVGSAVEASASALADCLPVDLLVAAGPFCLSCLWTCLN